MYTIVGHIINTAEQALTVYLVYKLQGNVRLAQQALSIHNKLSK